MSITAENPNGSINFIDTVAKGLPSVFYRAVSMETAKQAGKSFAGNANMDERAEQVKPYNSPHYTYCT